MTAGCETIRMELGGYALGGLAAEERERVESHAAACGRCAAELAELLRTSQLLGAVRAPTPPAPADLAHRVLDAHRRRSRRPTSWLVAATLLLVALAGVATGLVADGWRVDPAPDARLALAGEGGGALAGEAALRQSPNGVVVDLELTGVAGGDEGYYHLWLHRGDRRVSAGTFVGADGRADVQLVCGGQLDGYDRLTLTWHAFGSAEEVVAIDAGLPHRP